MRGGNASGGGLAGLKNGNAYLFSKAKGCFSGIKVEIYIKGFNKFCDGIYIFVGFLFNDLSTNKVVSPSSQGRQVKRKQKEKSRNYLRPAAFSAEGDLPRSQDSE